MILPSEGGQLRQNIQSPPGNVFRFLHVNSYKIMWIIWIFFPSNRKICLMHTLLSIFGSLLERLLNLETRFVSYGKNVTNSYMVLDRKKIPLVSQFLLDNNKIYTTELFWGLNYWKQLKYFCTVQLILQNFTICFLLFLDLPWERQWGE